MRRSTVLTTLALTASSLVLAAPASAMMPPGSQTSSKAGKLTCETYVAGIDSTGHARYDTVKNAKVTDSSTSKKKLGFKATAIGYYDSVKGDLLVSVVAADGTPRQVAMSFTKKGKVELVPGAKKYAQSSFKPRLFADNFGFYAYTVSKKGQLERWSLTRYRDGRLKYAQKVKLGGGYGDLTSLQATNYQKIKGVTKELLFATTSAGELLQIEVPTKKPTKLKMRTLATTGYAGVSEISWSICNDDFTHISLVAIDPVADVATWTTVKDVDGKPKSTLRGSITGGDGWDRVGTI